VSDYISWVAAATLVLGFGSGVLAGMFGIGGAVLTTPSIRVLGATPIQAVGSTVPAILPASISGAYRYAKEGLVHWRVGLICGFTGGVFAALGAKASDLIDAHYLMVLTAGLMAFSGISVIRSAKIIGSVPAGPAVGAEGESAEMFASARVDDPTDLDQLAPDAHLGVGLLVAVGAIAGGIAGLLGVGGGIVMVPAFTGILRLPMKLAVGSSLVAVAIFSIPALITHTVLGHIDWKFALPLMVGVIPGAQVGARLSFASSDVLVRRLFGWCVLGFALVYGVSEVLALQ